MPELPEDVLDWFVVIDETRAEDEEPPDSDPELGETPAVLLRRLRELVPEWRSLGIADEDTYAAWNAERLLVTIELSDVQCQMSIGCLRAELSDDAWTMGWVDPSLSTEPEFEHADPRAVSRGPVKEPEQAARTVTDWFVTQLSRPIDYLVWRDDSHDATARYWVMADTGGILLGSGPTDLLDQPGTADERVRVRP